MIRKNWSIGWFYGDWLRASLMKKSIRSKSSSSKESHGNRKPIFKDDKNDGENIVGSESS